MEQNEESIKSLNLPIDITMQRQIKSHVYYLEGPSGRFILKKKRKPGPRDSVAAKVLAFLDISFQREIFINRQMAEKSFSFFKAPKLVSSDGRDYMLFEYISGIDASIKDLTKEEIACSLYEFQNSFMNPYASLFDRIVSMGMKPISSLLRGILAIVLFQCGFDYARKALHAVKLSFRRQKPLKQAKLLHKDLRYDENYIISDKNELYLIDFASVVTERRWIMLDLIDVSFDAERLEVDFSLIKEYHQQLAKTQDVNGEVDLKAQVRIALMRKLIYYMHRSKYSNEQKKAFKRFLCETVLDDDSYEKWFCRVAGE